MRSHTITALVLLCTGCLSSLNEPETTPPHTGDTCVDYCTVVATCEPEHAYETCHADCRELLRDPDALRISGFEIRCWAAATDCQQAHACDE